MINVIGLGYIGLPTALMLASSGQEVVGTDCNKEIVHILDSGHTTFKESGLDELFYNALKKGIKFSHEYQKSNLYIVSVPTPYDSESKKINPCYLEKAVESILQVCLENTIIVIESTVSPGTIEKRIKPLIAKHEKQIGKDVHLVHAPERIIPGNMIPELIHNSRTIGADDKMIGEEVRSIYAGFCHGEIIVTDIRTAEMTKVVENTFRDINIAYANELAKICRSDGMDVYEIIRIANKHPRVNILSPGPGVGGHCIAVDPWFLVGDYPGLANIILAARKINDSMPEFVLKRVYDIMKENNMEDIGRVGFYGLTYKEDVDDTRESPALQILECMKTHLCGVPVKVYDPFVKERIVKNQYFDLEKFLEAVDLIVVLVGHQQIKDNLEKLKGKLVIDTKNILSLENTYKL